MYLKNVYFVENKKMYLKNVYFVVNKKIYKYINEYDKVCRLTKKL
jgi:hypothetical protein